MPALRKKPLPPTFWVTSEKLIQQILWVGLFAVLGPLLGPKSYGVFALAMAAYAWLEAIFTDAMGEALLLLREPTDSHYGVANLTNVAASILASALVFLASFPLSILVKDPELVWVMAALSPIPVLGAMTAGPVAYLKREMQFQQFALRSILGLSIGGGAGVMVALTGGGVWALVVQILVQRAAETAILWAASRSIFRFAWRRSAFEDLYRCTLSVALARSWTWVAALAPRVIIASVIGPTALGLFTIAGRISDLMCQILLYPATHVAHLKFLRLHGDQKAISDAFEALVGRLALVAFPVALGLAAVAQPLFQSWLGPKWEGAVIATQLMALTILPWTIFYAASALFMGLRIFWLDQRIQLGLAITTFAAAAIAAPFGLNATCAALLLRLVLLMLVPIAFFRIHAQIGLGVLFRALAGPTVAAGAMALAVDFAVPPVSAHLSGILTLPVLVTMGGVIYVGGVLLLAPGHVRSLIDDALDIAPARLRTAFGR